MSTQSSESANHIAFYNGQSKRLPIFIDFSPFFPYNIPMKKKTIAILLLILVSISFVHASNINDRAEVNRFDALAMYPYSKSLDNTATIINYTLMASPALLSITRSFEDIATIGSMYLETMIGADLSKKLIKSVADRPRPYTYFEGAPEDEKDDWNNSFPSGHTTMAFASAGFVSYVFSRYYPESKWKAPIISAAYTAATTTAVLRIMSGNHFMTDVLTGALLGTLWGIGIPMIHTFGDNVEVGITPFALAFSISF